MRKARFLVTLVAALCCIASYASDSTTRATVTIPVEYMPRFHGTFRTFYEYDFTRAESRFLVRNARLAAGGKVLPIAEYFFQVDLCDRGKMTILDAFVGVQPIKGMRIVGGQSRVPFSVGASRAPADYHFANRATMCKVYGNLRAAGVKVGYKIPKTWLYFEGGAFNGSAMTDHTPWNKSLTYSAKLNLTSPSGWMPQVCFMSRLPGGEGVRINQVDASLTYEGSHLFFEAEYCYRHYTNKAESPSHGYNIMADYGWPVRSRLVNRWSVQARIDGITSASSGLFNKDFDDSSIGIDYEQQNRITIGTTASYVQQGLHCDVRLNFEHTVFPADGGNIRENKFIAALVLYF